MRHAKVLFIVVALALIGVLSTTVHAQGGKAIKYGDIAKGEITDSAASISYTFKAEANDVVVIRMKQDGSDSQVSPHLVLLNAKNETIADSKDQVAIYSVNLAAQLTEAGDYTITASSADDKGKGQFQVALSQAATLKPGEAVKGKASSETYVYYSYMTGSPFSISYEKMSGDFAATVAVNHIDENHELRSVGELGGDQVAKAMIGIQPKQKELYVVSIGEGTLDINFQSVTADYSLTLAAEGAQ